MTQDQFNENERKFKEDVKSFSEEAQIEIDRWCVSCINYQEKTNHIKLFDKLNTDQRNGKNQHIISIPAPVCHSCFYYAVANKDNLYRKK